MNEQKKRTSKLKKISRLFNGGKDYITVPDSKDWDLPYDELTATGTREGNKFNTKFFTESMKLEGIMTLEETIEAEKKEFNEISEMIENEILHRYDSLKIAEDSAETVKLAILQWHNKSLLNIIKAVRDEVIEGEAHYIEASDDARVYGYNECLHEHRAKFQEIIKSLER